VTPGTGMTPGTRVDRKEETNAARAHSRADIVKVTGAPRPLLTPRFDEPILTGRIISNATASNGYFAKFLH
jgi:hypothetical protein